MSKFLYLAEKTPDKQTEDGKPIAVTHHGQVYTTEETICRVSGNDYQAVVDRVKLISKLLNEAA